MMNARRANSRELLHASASGRSGTGKTSLLKDVARAIAYLRDRGETAILLGFARDRAENHAVMGRGRIVLAGSRRELREDAVRRWRTV